MWSSPGNVEFPGLFFLNFQLNRFYSSGTIGYDELMEIGQNVKSLEQMTKNKRHPLWKVVNKKLGGIYFTKWLLQQGYEIYENVHTPFEYFNHIKQYNTRDISSLITQDTLVLAGEKDIYTIYNQDQLDALVNANSVTGRIFLTILFFLCVIQ